MDALAKRLYFESIQQLLTFAQLHRAGDLTPESFLANAAKICDTLTVLERNGHGELTDRLAGFAETGHPMILNPSDRPDSLAGDGLLVKGTVAVFYGQPGLGKTWLLLQLACSLAAGRQWLGITTVQSSVGYISLELPRYYLRERLLAIAERFRSSPDQSWLNKISVICRPTLKGGFDLMDASTLPALRHWAKEHDLQTIIIDPLSRSHSMNENNAQEMGAVLQVAERLAADGPLVILNHHEGHPNPELGSQHPRGSSRLLSDPNTVLNLTEHRGSVCLRVKKINLGIPIDPIYLKQASDGFFEMIDRPLTADEAQEEMRNALAEIIKANPGLTSAQIGELAPANPKTGKPYHRATIERHLSAIQAAGMVRFEDPAGPGGARIARLWFPKDPNND
jgi:hypothetical protein